MGGREGQGRADSTTRLLLSKTAEAFRPSGEMPAASLHSRAMCLEMWGLMGGGHAVTMYVAQPRGACVLYPCSVNPGRPQMACTLRVVSS